MLYLCLPWFFLRLLWRSRYNPAYRQRWSERLGFSPAGLHHCIWIHAVSVGETLAAIPLIKAIQKKYPEVPLLVTNMTITGSERVRAAFGKTVFNTYIPYDTPDAVHRFLTRINPFMLIIMETELWPNLFAACQDKNIPIALINARLSEKSARGYRLIRPVTRAMLHALNLVAAQTEKDANRFIELGIEPKKVHITGSLKFDMAVPSDLAAKSISLREQLDPHRPIWIAASTHSGEEERILAAHLEIRKKVANALLILVPRHPERFDAVASLVEKHSLSLIRRSSHFPCNPDTAVYLGDTMGELMLLYACSDVAFVGGSFENIGGHNMLEPAVLHKPVITGPVLFNFAEISERMVKANGMIIVTTVEQLAATVIQFFEDASYRQRTGDHAFAVVEKNRGALQRQLDSIYQLWNLNKMP